MDVKKVEKAIQEAADLGFRLRRIYNGIAVMEITQLGKVWGNSYRVTYILEGKDVACEFGVTLEQAARACFCFPYNIPEIVKRIKAV